MAEKTADKGAGQAMRIDARLVRELARLLESGNLTEIEVEDGDRRIKVQRSPAMSYSAPQPIVPAAPQAPQPAQAPAGEGAGQAEPATTVVDGTVVKSPMVGTAFLSPEPGAKPFVAVGDTVKAGDTLLIVEAMKVMNPITATASGTLKQLMVSDAQPVEFDQPLAIIG